MDDKNKTPNKQNNRGVDDQHTKQFDAIIPPKNEGQRNIVRTDGNNRQRNISRPDNNISGERNTDVYISPSSRGNGGVPVSGARSNTRAPSESEKAQAARNASIQRQKGASIPVSKRPSSPARQGEKTNPPQSVRRMSEQPARGASTAKKTPTSGRGSAAGATIKADVTKGGNTPAKKSRSGLAATIVLIVFIFSFSIAIAAFTLTCLNDILAINRTSEKISVSITDDMGMEEVVSQLKERGLIKNEWFCKLFAQFRKFDKAKFVPAIYELRPNMGVEGMLNEIKGAHSSKTATLVFPEGYTVDQIFEKLEKFEVCTASSLYTAMNEVDFTKDFPFLKNIDNKNSRYRWLDGYLYPDTYEFYIGENATSVIKRFLTNFQNRWESDYTKKAEALNMTMDEVLRLASIIEKEAFNADQMYTISGILHNRLKDTSGNFYKLGCDSTASFIMNSKELIEASGLNYDLLLASYDTYMCDFLPPGAICNPGDNAIKSALTPRETNLMFFRHDKNGKIYTAKTLAEHNAYQKTIDAVNSAAAETE